MSHRGCQPWVQLDSNWPPNKSPPRLVSARLRDTSVGRNWKCRGWLDAAGQIWRRVVFLMQFARDRATKELWLHQREYIMSLLAEYDLADCNPVSVPMDPHYPFGRDSDKFPVIPDLASAFRRIVGELLFLALCTRPDICYAVVAISQNLASPENRHYAATKCVLRYLKGTASYCLHYGGVSDNLHGFSDSDWGSDIVSRASVTGYVWFLAGGPIAWSLKKQTTIALSSTEAEYMALTGCVQEGLWLRSALLEAHFPVSTPISILADNNGVIALASNTTSHGRSKHIDIQLLESSSRRKVYNTASHTSDALYPMSRLFLCSVCSLLTYQLLMDYQ